MKFISILSIFQVASRWDSCARRPLSRYASTWPPSARRPVTIVRTSTVGCWLERNILFLQKGTQIKYLKIPSKFVANDSTSCPDTSDSCDLLRCHDLVSQYFLNNKKISKIKQLQFCKKRIFQLKNFKIHFFVL